MPSRGENGAAATAMAFENNGLVPYLGLIFGPGALFFGGLGLLRAWRAPQQAGHARRAAALSLALGLPIAGATLAACGVPEPQRPAYVKALADLARSEMIEPREIE